MVTAIPLRADDGLGKDLGVLFRLCLGRDLPGILPVFIHVAVDQSQQIVPV